MRGYFNRSTGDLSTDLYVRSHVALPFYAKRADLALLEVMFHRDAVPELPTDPLITFVLKTLEDYGGDAVVSCNVFEEPEDESGFYVLRPDFDEDAINDLLVDGDIVVEVANEAARLALALEAIGLHQIAKQTDTSPATYWELVDDGDLSNPASWATAAQKDYVDLGGEIVLQESPDFGEESTKSFTVRLYNDYYKGDEADTPLSEPFSRAFVANLYNVTGLTGGTDSDLDAVVTAGKNLDGALVAVNVDAGALFWRFRKLAITGISVAAAAVVTTAKKHGFTSGMTVAIGGSDCTPTIDGNRVITVLSDTTFSVPVTTTVAGDAGYATPAEDGVSYVRADDFNASTNPGFWQVRA